MLEIGEKFVGQAAQVLGFIRAEEVMRLCWRLPELADVRAVTELAN